MGEGVVWHGTGRFTGTMYKCHFGHLGLPVRQLRFSAEHVFLGHSSTVPAVAACQVPTIRKFPGNEDDVQQLVLLRHGESVAQTATRKQRGTSRSLLDSPLSENGQKQAGRVHIADMPELVITSPLTRALQTVGAIAPQLKCPCMAHPYLQEFSLVRPPGFESVGRTARELQDDDHIGGLSGTDLSLLGGLDCHWWEDVPETPAPRLAAFVEWLRARPERFILIIGHNNVFQDLLADRGSTSFDNCDPVNCLLPSSSARLVALPAPPATYAQQNSEVRLRICRDGDQKDVKTVKIERESAVDVLLKIAQNKWRLKKFRPRSAYLGNGQELTEDILRTITDDATITFK